VKRIVGFLIAAGMMVFWIILSSAKPVQAEKSPTVLNTNNYLGHITLQPKYHVSNNSQDDIMWEEIISSTQMKGGSLFTNNTAFVEPFDILTSLPHKLLMSASAVLPIQSLLNNALKHAGPKIEISSFG
jgi:hypothetical protein